MARQIDHLYIFSMIIFTVYSQLVVRWQVRLAGDLPEDLSGKIAFITQLFMNPWILSSLLATFSAGIAWMLAISRFDISYAYPWVSLNFIIIPLLGVYLFQESFSIGKLVGTGLVIGGVLILAKS